MPVHVLLPAAAPRGAAKSSDRVLAPLAMADAKKAAPAKPGGSVDALAVWRDANPLSARPERIFLNLPPRLPVILPSGTLAEEPFDLHPANWLGPGRAALESWIEEAWPILEREEREVWFRPHARHVLNDTQSTLQFFREHEGEPLGLALAPADLFERSMLAHAEDHLERIFGALGGLARVVILSNVRDDPADGERLAPAALADGLLDPALIVRAAERHLKGGTAIALAHARGPDLVRQFVLLPPGLRT